MKRLVGYGIFLLGCLLLSLWIVSGCGSDSDAGMDEKVLIRAGNSVITVRAFNEAFESSITAPSLLFNDTEALRNAKYRVLNRLSEELVILERSGDLGLQVSDAELEQVVTDIKSDYPDDTFEKTLMENGISYLSWEKSLKHRLLMEKTIKKDLADSLNKVPAAIEEKSETSPSGFTDAETLSNVVSTDTLPQNSLPELTFLPSETAETTYTDWIKRLEKRYPIEIDWKLWEKIEAPGNL